MTTTYQEFITEVNRAKKVDVESVSVKYIFIKFDGMPQPEIVKFLKTQNFKWDAKKAAFYKEDRTGGAAIKKTIQKELDKINA